MLYMQTYVCIRVINLIILETRGVNRAEISGPARKMFFGPARNQSIIKICIVQLFLKYYSKINIIT